MDINDAWKSTCKAILGDEIGDLEQYAGYLSRYVGHLDTRKSSISGRTVSIDAKYLDRGARILSHDEMEEYGKKTASIKLDINEIKDIDSILGAVGEKAYYAGNIISGKSAEIHGSTRCTDSIFVYNSYDIYAGKYVAYSSGVRFGEYMFGSSFVGDSRFLIGGYESTENTRCFDSIRDWACSDCYFSVDCHGCSNIMFSFNLRNKRNCIGNLELPREKYSELRAKLLEDIRNELRQKKRIASLIDIINE